MRLSPDCIPCTLRMMVGTAEEILPAGQLEEFTKKLLADPRLAGHDWDAPSPLLVAGLWPLLLEQAGEEDPFAEIKRRANEAALRLLPALRESVESAADPLEAAVKAAIAGNTMDAMIASAAEAPAGLLAGLEALTLFGPPVAELRRRLQCAGRLAYVTDNCGEIVFDRLLLEQVARVTPAEIVVVTHTVPIVNDALEEDARLAGLHEVARVIPGGTLPPVPGNLVGRMSPAAREAVLGADLVLAKGVANYELLTWEGALHGKLISLLHAKCPPIQRELQAPAGALVVAFR